MGTREAAASLMPRRSERHARSADWWPSQPSRSAELSAAASADPEPMPRPPGRKDTRAWCKGKPGVEHIRRIEFRPPSFRRDVTVTCEWRAYWLGDAVSWQCYHEARCARCGKILVQRVDRAQCPSWPGSEEQKAAAQAEAAAAREWWEQRRAGRKARISGPQHYRKRKAS